MIGNPDLLPTFNHNVNITFNTYKPVSGKYIWINFTADAVNNAFANSTEFDSIGRTISKTVNVNGNYSSWMYMGGGFPFFQKKLEINPNLNGSYNKYSSFINKQQNITTTSNVNAGLGIAVNLDTLTFNISYNYGYNSPSSTISTAGNKPYSDQQYQASLLLKLPFKFSIETDASYNINSNRTNGYNINYFLWNAAVNKSFFKNENLILTLSGNDILNQNINTSRNIQDNVITDNKTNIISRYFLLKLTYKFNSTKTKDDENNM